MIEPLMANVALILNLPRTDRKSTRLNSSHTVISYAVFCLKKKKTICIEINVIQSGGAGRLTRSCPVVTFRQWPLARRIASRSFKDSCGAFVCYYLALADSI